MDPEHICEENAIEDKRRYIEKLTKEAETAAGQRNMKKKLNDITRTLSGKKSNPSRPVKDKNGNQPYSQVKGTKELDGLNILRKH